MGYCLYSYTVAFHSATETANQVIKKTKKKQLRFKVNNNITDLRQ